MSEIDDFGTEGPFFGRKKKTASLGFDPSLGIDTSGSAAATQKASSAAAEAGPGASGGGGAAKGGGAGGAGGMAGGGQILNTALQAGLQVWQAKQAQKEAKKQRVHETGLTTTARKESAWGQGAQGETDMLGVISQLMNKSLL